MTLKDKMELVRLLNLYQNDLLDANEANIKEAAKYENATNGRVIIHLASKHSLSMLDA